MAQVMLRAPLSELCGGRTHAIPGATVSEVLVALERAHPPIAGWVLDEQGRIREHVNVFVNGTHGEGRTPVGDADRVQVLPAITGG
jgi:molybdopterin converting factor small subunit